MKKHRLLAAILVLIFILAGCSSNKTGNSIGENPKPTEENRDDTSKVTERNNETVTNAVLPKELVQIPVLPG